MSIVSLGGTSSDPLSSSRESGDVGLEELATGTRASSSTKNLSRSRIDKDEDALDTSVIELASVSDLGYIH